MSCPSPTPTEGLEPLIFAKLYPNNKLACQCFSDVVGEILLGKYTRQAQFLEYGFEQTTLENAVNFAATPTQDDTGPPEQETETDSDSDLEQELTIRVWTGAYILSLERLPAVPALGWRIGRFVENVIRETVTREVDLLLCLPNRTFVRGNHARLAFNKISGILSIHSRHRDLCDGITLNGESFSLSSRALHGKSSTLRFGDLEYIFRYDIAANSPAERFFQADKKGYFANILSSPPPLESTSSTPSSEDITIGKWKLHTQLGRGAYGSVAAASHATGKIVAFKSLLRYDQRSAKAISKEIEMASTITELLQNNDRPHIILQGTIRDILAPAKQTFDVRVHAFQQLLLGLQWLHSHRLVHRDIKPVNIGLTLDPLHVSILDLGTVGKLDDTTGLIAPTPGQLGTVHYLAPEMELDDYNEKVDIWASGLVGCEIILGRHPWPLSINPWRPDINEKFDDYKAKHGQFLRSLKIKADSEECLLGTVSDEKEESILRRAKCRHNAWHTKNTTNAKATAPVPTYQPFLLIVPSTILMQWANEIQKVTDAFDVRILFGDKKAYKTGTWKKASLITEPLTCHSQMFDGSFENANIIILTTYDTFRSRHGPPAVERWLRKQGRKNPMQYSPSLAVGPSDYKPPGWPGDLEGVFHDVILDEGHTVRNKDSGLSISIRWLQAKFHLIMSGTIFYNSIMDFAGYVNLIVAEETNRVWDQPDKMRELNVDPGDNPFALDDSHAGAFLRFTRRGLDRFVFSNSITVAVASVRLKMIMPSIMVRRTLSSVIRIRGQMVVIGARIPPSQTRIINVQFTDVERNLYDTLVAPHYKGLIMEKDHKIVLNMAKYRMLTLLTTWLGFEYVESVLTASNLDDFLKLFAYNTVCQSLGRTVYHKQYANARTWFEVVRKEGKKIYPSINAIRTLLRGSPKMRAMLPIVIHNCLVRKEKQIIWCNFPANQIHVAAVLKECGIDARIFHAKLDYRQRDILIHSFTNTDECQILIMSLAVNALGLNLQPRCNIMHFYDLPITKAVMDQAIGRLRRFGQQLVVIVYVYQVSKSWNTRQATAAGQKAVASMICDLNVDMFKMAIQSTEDVRFFNWVVRNGHLHRLGNGEKPLADDITEDTQILQAIQDSFVEQVGLAADSNDL
uniref:Serine/threonine-protein kinase pakH n=1 Tax=Talaromyces marneffei PM1 TaxID=1077442 RepID=A0A093V772_TALMA